MCKLYRYYEDFYIQERKFMFENNWNYSDLKY